MVRELVWKYALQNAIFYDGKADAKAVLGKILAEEETLRSKAKEVFPLVEEIVKEINRLSLEEQEKELERIAPEMLIKEKIEKIPVLPELPNVGEKVVMRLAPFPSGPLHIGNARSMILNDEYVKRYKGKLILVHDDTIGSEEKIPLMKAYSQIEEGLKWMGVDYHQVVYKSDRLSIFYEWCEKLLKGGHAYVCECPAEKLRIFREEGKECPCRIDSPQSSLDKWRKMLDGGYGEGGAVVRLKTSMKHPNPAFRDRVLLRISEREHPRVGRKYRVWPLLEFSWAIDDYDLGVTHILRGKDLLIEDEMERAIWNYLGIKGSEFVHYGLLRFADVELSKSKFQREIEEGRLEGIDDPRTWTMQSLMRRGIQPQALRNFILSFGMSLTDIEVPIENLYAENRRMIDPQANRYFFVLSPVKITIGGLPKIEEVRAPLHPEFPDRGMRKLRASDIVFISKEDFDLLKGKEIRLKDFCNIILDEKSTFTSMKVKDVPKIQWLSEGIPVKVVMPDGQVEEGLGELNLKETRVGEVIQFERFGFARIDSKNQEIKAYFAHR